MSRRSVRTLFVAGLVLLATLPSGVAAQGPPGTLLLNEDATEFRSVTYDGQSYTLYRYENTLPYASGIAIYAADGDRVTSPERARAVLTALAHQRTVEQLGPEDASDLRALARNASAIGEQATETIRRLERTTEYTDRLRSVSAGNRTAWNASTTAATQLDGFNGTAAQLQAELRDLRATANATAANASALAGRIERQENGSEIADERLYQSYRTTLQLVERLTDRAAGLTGDGGFTEGGTLSSVAERSETISVRVYDVSDRGPEIASHFIELSHDLRTHADRMKSRSDAVSRTLSELTTPRESADDRRSRLMKAWESRQNASIDIYATLVGGAIAALGLVGYAGRKW